MNATQFHNYIVFIVYAAQSIKRFGFEAVVGLSFGEIFFHNSVAIGLPCLKISSQDLDELKKHKVLDVNLEENTITGNEQEYHFDLEQDIKSDFINGNWDSLTLLLENI